MTTTVPRQRIEVLVDAPLVRRVVEAAESVGATGYTLLPTLGGAGSQGHWSDDQISGADAKVMFLTITSDEKAEALTDALAPLLQDYGLILMVSPVNVVRGGKF